MNACNVEALGGARLLLNRFVSSVDDTLNLPVPYTLAVIDLVRDILTTTRVLRYPRIQQMGAPIHWLGHFISRRQLSLITLAAVGQIKRNLKVMSSEF